MGSRNQLRASQYSWINSIPARGTSIKEIMYDKFEARIHLDNFMMHNCIQADPLSPEKKEMVKYSSKRKKTDEDHMAMALIEYRSSLYLNTHGQCIIPSRMSEGLILAAAKDHREGKLAASGVFVDQDTVIEYKGGPLTVDELLESPHHRYVAPVVVQKARLMRTRPLFEEVKASIIISINTDICTENHLKNWLLTGLNVKGFGDYRPRFGRGRLLELSKIS